LQEYDGWELMRDENDPPREITLGSGGQGTVYLVRTPERAAKRRDINQQIRDLLMQSQGGRYDPLSLAKNLFELGGPEPVESLAALKRFNIGPDDRVEAQAVGRLESEVKALKSLKDHPGVLKLLYANITQRFIVTEYHKRGTLNTHLKFYEGKALAALEAFGPLVDAVQKIHENGAIHRDIKPENIFISMSGNLVLGDFGIVFFQQDSDRLTTTYERVGSHEWMSPWAYKKARLNLSEIDPTLDIFPLTKVLWSMIAGQNGFPYWEYTRDENNLERLFPDDPIMTLVNDRIFSKRIVREAHECDPSALSLREQVEDLIKHIKTSRGYRPDAASTWPCRICGKGTYQCGGPTHQLKGYRQGGPVSSQEIALNACICDHCGHAELFKSR
jgi:serine/threonine protein kinase